VIPETAVTGYGPGGEMTRSTFEQRNGLIPGYLSYLRGEAPSRTWALLRPLGPVFATLVRLRNLAYDRGLLRAADPPIPVVSVGNLTLGGTNKTPLVELLARGLGRRGLRAGIASRGYGGRSDSPLVFAGGRAERERVGDEPLLLSDRLPDVPIAVARKRIEAVRALAGRGAAIAIADDAFQHRALARAADLVLIDATCPFGNGRSIPAGPLREPPSSLQRADLCILTRCDLAPLETLRALEDRLARWIATERIFRSRLEVASWGVRGADPADPAGGTVGGRSAVAFSAIGNPRSFFDVLEAQQVEARHAVVFRDHHRYSLEDLAALDAAAEQTDSEILVCTEKDLYNLPAGWTPARPLLFPRVELRLTDEPAFWKALGSCLEGRAGLEIGSS
jgi:tetraacyldisaccharide 4'-kinase